MHCHTSRPIPWKRWGHISTGQKRALQIYSRLFFKLTSFMDAFAKVNITYNNFLLMKHTFIGDYIICILVSFTSTIG